MTAHDRQLWHVRFHRGPTWSFAEAGESTLLPGGFGDADGAAGTAPDWGPVAAVPASTTAAAVIRRRRAGEVCWLMVMGVSFLGCAATRVGRAVTGMSDRPPPLEVAVPRSELASMLA